MLLGSSYSCFFHISHTSLGYAVCVFLPIRSDGSCVAHAILGVVPIRLAAGRMPPSLD